MTATTGNPPAGRPAQEVGRMPLLEHLRELRSRLIRSVIAIVLGSVAGFVFYNEVIDVLIEPVCDTGVTGVAEGRCGALVVSGVIGPLALQLKVALFCGLIFASPVWLWQLWAFLAPGLHRREKRWTYLFVGAGAPLFFLGAVVSYLVLPVAVRVLLDFAPADVANFLPLDEYLDFVLRMILVFGISFELPLALVMANMAGLVTSRKIRSWWRQMIFGIFVFAAAATPTGDPFTLAALAAPMTVLYGVAIVITAILDRGRARREAAAGNGEDLP